MPLPATLDPHLEEALRHVLDNPGSLVRPRMVLSRRRRPTAWTALTPKIWPSPLEYFHTASLLFDDLPCMDNASSGAAYPAFISHMAKQGDPCRAGPHQSRLRADLASGFRVFIAISVLRLLAYH